MASSRHSATHLLWSSVSTKSANLQQVSPALVGKLPFDKKGSGKGLSSVQGFFLGGGGGTG